MDIVNQMVVHDNNTALILHMIQDHAPISRAKIAEVTGLASSTVSVIAGELEARKLIRACGTASSTGGRRPILLELNPKGGYFICADLGGSQLKIGIVDLTFNIVRSWQQSLAGCQGAELYSLLVKMITEAQNWCHLNHLPILGLGIAIPGLVDSATGDVLESDHLNLHNFHLRDILEQVFDWPIVVENDTNAAAFGEYKYGSIRDLDMTNMMYVTMMSGIGSGLILDRALYTGSSGMAGELGHVVMTMKGTQCACGKRGCLETLASSRAMVRRYNQLSVHMEAGVDGTQDSVWLLARAVEGDEIALQVFSDAGYAVGVAVGNQVNVLNLDTVLFGGLITHADWLFSTIMSGLHDALLPTLKDRLVVRPASLGGTAGLVGIASLSLHKLFKMRS